MRSVEKSLVDNLHVLSEERDLLPQGAEQAYTVTGMAIHRRLAITRPQIPR
jgi:hypothetical protein